MTYLGATGWAKATILPSDLIDNLAIIRFGNHDDDGNFYLNQYSASSWYNEEENFLVIKVFEL